MRPILRGENATHEPTNCKSRSEPVCVSENKFRQTETLSSFTQVHCRIPWKLDYSTLFRQPLTRTWQREISQLSPFQSTVEAFEIWLRSAPVNEIQKYENHLGPGSMIFRIAHQDTMGLLRLMRLAVAKIDVASSDTELQETALHWRCQLDEFRALLLELEGFFRSFVGFLHGGGSALSKVSSPALDSDPIGYLLHDGLHEIEVHKQRISQVYSSLTSKTQISDSHRSITEAETVTRLTELAFLFIPLSFSTSIFGMQFINGSTRSTTYIAVAIALTSAAYILRFIIDRTTEQRANLKKSIRGRITAYAKLRIGSRIPAATFFRWLVHIVNKFLLKFRKWSLLGAIILSISTIALPIIWTSILNTGLQIAISCLLVSIPICFVGFYFSAKYVRRQRLRNARALSDP